MGKDLKGKMLDRGITQRKDGRYQARFKDRFGNTKYIYDDNLKNLRKKLVVERANDIQKHNTPQEITLDEWFERWLKTYKEPVVKRVTLSRYVREYNKHIAPVFGGYYLTEITKGRLQEYFNSLRKDGLGDGLIRSIRVLLKDLLKHAFSDELIERDPTNGIMIRFGQPKPKPILSVLQEQEFFKTAEGNFYENFFRVAANTGMRAGELFALEESDIDFDKGYIRVSKTLAYEKYVGEDACTVHVTSPKTKASNRLVPMNTECRKYLTRQITQKKAVAKRCDTVNTPYLFVNRRNGSLTARVIDSAIESVVKKTNMTSGVEIPHITAHCFRHMFATRCFEAGIQPKVVQAYLGHATLQMTMDLYTHVTEEIMSEDIEKIRFLHEPAEICNS